MSRRPSPVAVEVLEGRALFSAAAAAVIPTFRMDARIAENPYLGTIAADPAEGDLTAHIRWGDGTSSTATAAPTEVDAGRQQAFPSHAYGRVGRYAVRVSYTDAAGAVVGRARGTAVVIPNVLTTPAIHARAGRPFDGVVSIYRAGRPFDDNKVVIDWGDGTAATDATVTMNGNMAAIRGTHTYAAAGRYIVSVSGYVYPSSSGTGVTPAVVVFDNSVSGMAIVRR